MTEKSLRSPDTCGCVVIVINSTVDSICFQAEVTALTFLLDLTDYYVCMKMSRHQPMGKVETGKGHRVKGQLG